MSVQGNDDNINLKMVSEKDEYLWAFLAFRSSVEVTKHLNEQISDFWDYMSEKETLEIVSKNLTNKLEKLSERVKKIREIADRENLKNVYFPLNVKDECELITYGRIARKVSKTIIADMSLVYVVALFEDFLQKILQISFEKKPETLMTSRKTVTYEELLKSNDINEAKKKMIEKEKMIVNEDIEEVRKYLKSKFKVDIAKFVNWKEFKERFYRRNVLIHNSGMPNEIYRLKTGYTGKNKRLTVSKKYLTDSINLFNTMSLRVASAFETKMKKA